MKPIHLVSRAVILSALISVECSFKSTAQSAIGFANNALSALTSCETCQRLPVASTFRVALYAAPAGSLESDMLLVAGPIGITGAPGLFNGGVVAIPFILGERVQFQVRAWDGRGGAVPTYEAATANLGVLKGKSGIVTTVVSIGSTLIAAGLRGFTLSSSDCIVMYNCPTNITVNPSCSNGVPVYYSPTATNRCTGASVPVSCSPPSGFIATNQTTTLVTCTASDGLGNSKSCTFNVSVTSTNLIFTQPPLSRVVVAGTSVTFSSSVIGPAPRFFQWRRNGVVLLNATNSFHTVASAQPADEGTYAVSVTTACGTATSASATLTVMTSAINGILVPSNAFWNYRFDGVAPGAAWSGPSFDDSSWNGGRAELGFGDGDEVTVIGAASNGFITAYFRRPFLWSGTPPADGLAMTLYRDDGAVIYLNGVEIHRSNMATGPVNYFTLALVDPFDGKVPQTAVIPASDLVPGRNVLAAEVHQHSPTSSDLSFSLQLAVNRPPVALGIRRVGSDVILTWDNPTYRLQAAPAIVGAPGTTAWTTQTNTSPASFASVVGSRFFRLVRP